MTNLVECHNLRLGYGSNAMPPCPNFTVGAGDCLVIAGPNGTGKTTLLKCIAGLLKPLSGTLTFASGLANGGIGYMPQQGPLQRDFPASVREVVQSGCQALRGLRPFYTRAEKRRTTEAMERGWAYPLLRSGATANSPADSASASCSPALSAASAVCCSSTSRRRASIRMRPGNSTARCETSTPAVLPSSWCRTTSMARCGTPRTFWPLAEMRPLSQL